jgi:hypothetical protein
MNNNSINYLDNGFIYEVTDLETNRFKNPDSETEYFYFKYAADQKHTISIKTKLDQSIDFEKNYLGKRRNVSIYSISIPAVKDDFIIKVEYGKIVHEEKSSTSFVDLLNRNHVHNFLEQDSKKDRAKIQNEDWYDENKDYLLIETDKDAPAVIQMSDIIEKMPALEGLPSRGLHLLHYGKSYPIYLEDADQILSNNDLLIFLGKRAKGDTTWYDFYTKYEPFYLYYDDEVQGKRLQIASTPSSFTDEIESVEVDRIIPVHQQYYDGHSFETEKVPTEGWMSRFFHPYQGNRFFLKNVYLHPSDNENDALDISVNYLAINTTVAHDEIDKQYNLEYQINNQEAGIDKFEGLKFGQLNSEQNQNLFPGMNSLELLSMPVANENKAGFTSVMSFNIKGKEKPHAIDGVSQFKINNLSDNSKITIPGFKSERIIAIDKENDQLWTMLTKNSTTLRIAADKKGDHIVMSTVINGDTSAYANHAGVLLTYFSDGIVYSESYYEPNSFDITETLQDIPEGSIIAFAFAADLPMSSSIKFELEKLGAQNIPITGTYAFGCIKGSDFKYESQNVNRSIINEVIDHRSGDYIAEFVLVPGSYDIVAADEQNYAQPIISKVSKNNLDEIEDGFDAMVITHPDLLELAKEYKAYREQDGYDIRVVDVYDIYKKYNYGRISPEAIKEFLNDIYFKNGNSNTFKYLTILGDASWDPGGLLNFSISNNFVPIYGYPYSDFWYGLLDDDYEAELFVGRIPVNNREQFESYMDKVKTHDNIPAQPWMKDFLFLSGGDGGAERDNFRGNLLTISDNFVQSDNLGGNPLFVSKQDEIPGSELKGGEIRAAINAGKVWTTFLGHAAADIYDLEGWQVERLNNENRYGILTTLSCNTGDFANPQLKEPRNEAYIMEPKKGFVISMGSTTAGFVLTHTDLAELMYYAVVDPDLKLRTISDILHYAKASISNQSFYLYTKMHYSILGDPLLKIRIKEEPDPFVLRDDLNIINESSITDQIDSAYFYPRIHNNGICTDENYEILVIRGYENRIDSMWYELNGICKSTGVRVSIAVKDMPGQHRFDVYIDPLNKSMDSNRDNNHISFNINVLSQGLSMLEPQPYWNMDVRDMKIRVIDQLRDTDDSREYHFVISDTNSLNEDVILFSDKSEININESFVEWSIDNKLEYGKNYWVGAYYITEEGNPSQTLWIPFNTYSDEIEEHAGWIIKSASEFNSTDIGQMEAINVNGSDRLRIKDKQVPVNIISYSGNPELGSTNHSYISMDVDENTFVDGFYFRGINIVRVPVVNDNNIGTYKRFDTWGSDDTYGEEWFKDSVAIKLVEYLRDSVQKDEYLIIGTCNSVWRMPLMHKIDTTVTNEGSLDTLKDVLNTFGSVLIDSVEGEYNYWKTDWRHSFAMIGRKGMKQGTITEAMNNTMDSVIIDSEITRYNYGGGINTDLIGPAKKWESVEISGFLPLDNYKSYIFIDRYNNEKRTYEIVLQDSNTMFMDLSSLSVDENPRIKVRFYLYRTNFDLENLTDEKQAYIDDIIVNYVPVSEITALKSTAKVSRDEILRGEEVTFKVDIKNISRRATSNESKMLFRIAKPDFVDEMIDIPALAPDEVYTFERTINTSSMVGNIQLFVETDPNIETNELYSYNNTASASFVVKQDTTAPEIELKIDNKFVTNGDFVQVKPELQIKVFDNSPLPIEDNENILVFINSIFMDTNNSSKFVFESFGSNELKATLNLIPENNLEFGTDVFLPANSIRVVAFDATGNSDTVRVLVNASLNAVVEELLNYPNPFTNSTTFKWNYRAKDNTAKATIEIYDNTGRQVEVITKNAIIGENSITWDARNKYGKSLSSGIYHYRITIEGFFTEPVYGKFIIVN